MRLIRLSILAAAMTALAGCADTSTAPELRELEAARFDRGGGYLGGGTMFTFDGSTGFAAGDSSATSYSLQQAQ
jgi:hypothetical protein